MKARIATVLGALCLLLVGVECEMAAAAGPVSHVYTANYLNQLGLLEVANRAMFFRGTVFNDIRYLGVVGREKTHQSDVTWKQVVAEGNSFRKGMLLHSRLDVVREEYVVMTGWYEFVPSVAHRYRSQVLKMAEDTVLYEEMAGLHQLDFQTVDQEQRQFDIGEPDLLRWGALLTQYFSAGPRGERLKTLAAAFAPRLEGARLEVSPVSLQVLATIVQRIADNPKFKEAVLMFYQREMLTLIPSAGN